MHDLTLLRDLVILVALAVPAIALAERFKVPSVVAFLLTGMLIGPHALGLIAESESVSTLAELGVVLLLFEIGLEVSLASVIRMRSVVLWGGLAQVLGTIGIVGVIGLLFGMQLNVAVVFGALIALSSTAIVLKVYRDRGELDTPHGRIVLAILLFQDLAIVPLIVLVPLLAGTGDGDLVPSVVRIGSSLATLATLVVGGRLVVPWLLERVVGFKNRELFTLTIGVLGLGAAYITALFGLSLALGAFVAGLIISESDYGVQALSDVLPFRVLFSGIFFTSVGMLLDFGYVSAHLPALLAVATAVVLGKALVVASVTIGPLRHSLFTATLAGLGLAQVGEFSYVLAGVASSVGLLDADGYQLFLGASILSMVAAPFLILVSRPFAESMMGVFGRTAPAVQPFTPPHVGTHKDHTIIVGFGLGGRHLAKILRAVHLPYLVLEMNGQTVRRARQDREPVLFGDGTRRDVLEHAGIQNAQAIVFSISSPTDERRGVSIARQLNPEIRILVRTRYIAAIRDLEQLGATDVVVEEYEAALELFRRVLRYYRIPLNTIETELAAMRTEQYGLLRGMPKHALHLDELKFLGIHHVLELVEVEPGAPAVGQSPTSLELRTKTGATVVAVVREAQPLFLPDPTFRFQAGDTVVLVGDGPAITLGMAPFRAQEA